MFLYLHLKVLISSKRSLWKTAINVKNVVYSDAKDAEEYGVNHVMMKWANRACSLGNVEHATV
jgi:hypothetical protein